MSRALIVNIKEHMPVPQGKRAYWDAWYVCAQRWLDYFDHVYVLGDAWGTDGIVLPLKFDVLPEHNTLDGLADTIRHVTEDVVFVMSSDVLFYSREEIRTILKVFDSANFDIAAILDNVGSPDLSKRFPELRGNRMRAERNRIAPYMFLAKTSFLQGTSLDFPPRTIPDKSGDAVWYDPFVRWTEEVMNKQPKFFELRDVRHSLFMSDTGALSWSANLDGHPYTWSIDGYYDIGYYRIRGVPLEDTGTFEEAMRNLAWHWILSCIFESNLDWQDESTNTLSDYDVNMDDWLDYIEIMKAYYPWTEEL